MIDSVFIKQKFPGLSIPQCEKVTSLYSKYYAGCYAPQGWGDMIEGAMLDAGATWEWHGLFGRSGIKNGRGKVLGTRNRQGVPMPRCEISEFLISRFDFLPKDWRADSYTAHPRQGPTTHIRVDGSQGQLGYAFDVPIEVFKEVHRRKL